ncbi:MAG: dipeptidase [Planctomycetales bacterium]|nr:dipeptidase [Planctomycetales bacterium]
MEHRPQLTRRHIGLWGWAVLAIQIVASTTTNAATPEVRSRRAPITVTAEAEAVHRSALVFDGHNDLPWALRSLGSSSFERMDIAKPQKELHTDIPRLLAGGVGAQFWSVYVPASTMEQGASLQTTLEQIEIVKQMMKTYPETFELALTADDIERIRSEGRIASLIGMEGGHSIENSINTLRQLYREGARYMTLAHSKTLAWVDSATDDQPHGGLTDFGEQVVREMNRLGMLVDISHVSVETMKDTLRISTAPVMFSHSSARAIADHPRNVPDDVLKLIAKNDGVVMINFYPGFIQPEAAKRGVAWMEYRKQLEQTTSDEEAIRAEMKKWEVSHPMPTADIYDVLDHIDHVVRVAGVDHVGLGSDYDGIDAIPQQLEDVSTYPRLTQGLLDRGYTAEQIGKILGANMMRVLRGAESARTR